MDLPFSKREALLCLPIFLVGSALATALFMLTQTNMERARERHIEAAENKTRTVQKSVEAGLDHIYSNLRTLAHLPGVKKIDRHAKNIDADTRTTFQQVYNNLATAVDISEVYIISADFNPDRFDPVTLKNEEPILMFDELIIDGGAQRSSLLGTPLAPDAPQELALQEEVEMHEYRQFVEVIGWYQKNYPSQDKIKGLSYPIRSGQSVITCDNRFFNKSVKDDDRKGMTFSVPFYRADGKLGGVVTAIVLNRALNGLVPSQDYALVSLDYDFATLTGTGQADASREWVKKALADSRLTYSQVVPVSFPDPFARWHLWAGEPEARFLSSAEVNGLRAIRALGFPAIAFLTLAAMLAMLMYERNRRLAQSLEREKLQTLSNLTAKFSHEIRNPLSSINNAVFIIRRVAGTDEKLLKQTSRAETAIKRCDKLIADMLAFGQPQPPILRKGDFAEWLAEIVAAYDFPVDAIVRLEFHEEPLVAQFDEKQLARAVRNLLENAIQSVPPDRSADLHLECMSVDGQIVLTISDNGQGLSKETAEKSFEPLFTTKNFGAGLGLPIAREILKTHNGALTLESRPEGGAVAKLVLPRARTAEIISLQKSA